MDNVLSSLNHHEQQPSFPPELYSPSEIQRVTDTQPDHEMFSGDVGGDGLASTTFEATNLNDDEGEPLSSIWNTLGLPPVVSHEQQHRSSSTSAPPPDVPPPRPLFHAESDRAQLGFYGPTSQCYLQYPCHGPDLDDLEIDPSPPPPLLLKIDADSPSARKAVLESYWKSNELWSSIVDRCFFIAHKAAGHASQYYSQGLEDAMLACGSRNSTSSAIRKVGREYLRRAKMNLQIEIENPTVAALQGCLLVSNYEAGTGQNRIGWMFMGMAVRLLLDLGLHEDRSTLVENGAISVEEWRYQKRLFLGTFLYDTIWGWFIGRPRGVPLLSVTVVTSTNTVDDGDQSHLYEWTSLCSQMARAQDIINGPQPLDPNTMDQLYRIYLGLESEYDNLPTDLAWREGETVTLEPSAYTLHTQYLATQIMLLRPPGRRNNGQTTTTQAGDNDDATAFLLPGLTLPEVLGLIRQKAVRIARLVQLLTQIHGVELVVPTILDNVFVAALSLIRNALRDPLALEEDEQWLRLFARTLGSVQRHYHMACRIRKALTSIVENTTMEEIFKVKSPGSDSTSSPQRLLVGQQRQQQHLLQGQQCRESPPSSIGNYLWPIASSGDDGLLMDDFHKDPQLPSVVGMNPGGDCLPNLAWFSKA
ncbi:hypothetical protein H2204_009780 [Knufia peltigerae]|uniref:Xylanolytic transcriptional activator regulatory domain-containing protein n=1 Tax=Knufia peltigerae TaxID=1002370 RepID=A0AA39CTE9_9EURO|nr:hypothetical protein H2204_009780 [Knufia peltigerae]